MVVRQKADRWTVQMKTEERRGLLVLTLDDQRFELSQSEAEDIAAAVQEKVYEAHR